nr:unnamed protein product [Digitaria exilis]
MSCFSHFFKRGRGPQWQDDPSNDEFTGSENIIRYNYKELVRATSNFDKANKIGEGGYGPVYKGTLRDGTDIAVKVLSLHSRQGQVTRKADVYSYGVLLIEIVSGRCNTDTKLPYDDQILLEKTWRYYEEGNLEKIIDSSLGDDLDIDEACRFLKVGLLCTQDVTKRRPGMSAVVAMLKGEADVVTDTISKPDVIRDFRDLTLRSRATSSTLLTSIMARSSPLSSEETTRTSITFTAISERD